jgi:hypothetical protein
MDAKVARVMGWNAWKVSSCTGHWLRMTPPGDEDVPNYWECAQGDEEIWVPDLSNVPRYSTQWGAAGLALEWAYDNGWSVEVCSLALIPRGWRCTMQNMFCADFFTHPVCIEESADTGPLAICQAILKAFGDG